ncbi:MAG: hypothetical protein AAFR05_14445 [Bacteroidota bacterium]
MENGKLLLDTFQRHLLQNFQTYCDRQGQAPTAEDLVVYLIDRQLLSTPIVRRYAVQFEFEGLYPDHGFHKSNTVATLADRFQISDRHVWSLLKYNQQKSQRKRYRI